MHFYDSLMREFNDQFGSLSRKEEAVSPQYAAAAEQFAAKREEDSTTRIPSKFRKRLSGELQTKLRIFLPI